MTLLDLLSQQVGDYATVKLVRDTKPVIAFSAEELEKYEFTQRCTCPKCGYMDYMPMTAVADCPGCKSLMRPEGIIKWEPTDEEKDLEIDSVAKATIATSLKRMSEEKQLTERHLSLYEKLVGKE